LYVEEWDLERTTLHIWEERKLVDQVGYVGTQLILLAFFWSGLGERLGRSARWGRRWPRRGAVVRIPVEE
jgi:cytochrome b